MSDIQVGDKVRARYGEQTELVVSKVTGVWITVKAVHWLNATLYRNDELIFVSRTA